MNRAIILLTLSIILLTVILKGYYRVETVRNEYVGAKDTLISIAEARYASLDSLIKYYRMNFSEESEIIDETERALSDFHKGNMKSIEGLENYIFNMNKNLESTDMTDVRVDSIRIFLSHIEESNNLFRKALDRYNSTIARFEEIYSNPFYSLFARFMIGERPMPITIEHRLLNVNFLPVEHISAVKSEALEELIESAIRGDTLKEPPGSTRVDTLKKEEGEGDKSDQAGVSTPGE